MAVQNKLKIFSGNSNPALAKAICKNLKITSGKIEVGRFPEGEVTVQVQENVRGCDVFIVQPTCPPSNDSMMELLIMIDALRRASAKRITAVLPFYGYARQDRKDRPRVPITAKLVANLITTAGADRVLTMDLHADQIQGFFDIPVDNLQAAPVFINYFIKKKLKNLTIATPDVGGIKLARLYSEKLKAPLAIVDKRRSGPTEAMAMNVIGDVEGKNVLLVDDMIATGGSLAEAVAFLKKKGAKDVYACCSHPILSGKADEHILKSQLKELVVTDSIPIHNKKFLDKVRIRSVANLFGEAIHRIHTETTVSTLFK